MNDSDDERQRRQRLKEVWSAAESAGKDSERAGPGGVREPALPAGRSGLGTAGDNARAERPAQSATINERARSRVDPLRDLRDRPTHAAPPGIADAYRNPARPEANPADNSGPAAFARHAPKPAASKPVAPKPAAPKPAAPKPAAQGRVTERQDFGVPRDTGRYTGSPARDRSRAKAAQHGAQPIEASTAAAESPFRSAQDIEQALRVERPAGSGHISRMREPRLLSIDDLEQKRIIHPAHANRRWVDSFRDLRTRLLQSSKGRNFTLVVSSVMNNGGASFTAVNLAAAFAFDSSRTSLLIDCNLRYPSLHYTFDMMPDIGVTDYLDETSLNLGSIIYPTGIRRMRFIPAGKRKESTGEYFTSGRMQQLLKDVHQRYPDRFIILDTPSINESPDAGILARLTDYTLLVVPHGRVTRAKALQACDQVPPERLAGVVFNH